MTNVKFVLKPGDVIRLDDRATDFDHGKIGRPNCVVRVIEGEPPLVYVVPRTTRGSTGTFVPAGALPGLTEDGRFLYVPRLVSTIDLDGAAVLGHLDEPYKSRVLEAVNDADILV